MLPGPVTTSVAGSHTPWAQADVWYDGALVYRNLDLSQWTVKADATSTVERSCQLAIVGTDPALNPDRPDSPLAVYGSEVQIKLGVDLGRAGVQFVSSMWGVIRDSDPVAQYATYNPKKFTHPVSVLTGVGVGIAADDRALRLSDARFESPEYSSAGTLYGEVARLCLGLVPVGVHEVPDMALGTIVYEGDDRLKALDTIAERAGARLSLNPMGEAVLRPRLSTGDTWVLPEGEDAIILDVQTKVTRDGFYNALIVRGTEPGTNRRIQQAAYEQTGPYRHGGPAGKVPKFYESPLITSDAQASQAAYTMLRDLITSRRSLIRLQVISNPALEPLDTIEWVHGPKRYTGTVKTIEWRHTGVMTLDVWVPLDTARSLS